jgi:hypothetical protein
MQTINRDCLPIQLISIGIIYIVQYFSSLSGEIIQLTSSNNLPIQVIMWDDLIKKGQTTHCSENSNQIFPGMKLRGLVPNLCNHVSTERLIYSHNRPTYSMLLYCVRGPNVGIYKSLADTWKQKFGTRPRSFISGNIFQIFGTVHFCSVW